MSKIFVKSREISLNPNEVQISPLGREFRLSGIKIDYTKTPKFLRKYGVYWHATSYIFKYLDNDEFFGFYFDIFDNFSHKINHEGVLKLSENG